jgi:hypothetical protein
MVIGPTSTMMVSVPPVGTGMTTIPAGPAASARGTIFVRNLDFFAMCCSFVRS